LVPVIRFFCAFYWALFA